MKSLNTSPKVKRSKCRRYAWASTMIGRILRVNRPAWRLAIHFTSHGKLKTRRGNYRRTLLKSRAVGVAKWRGLDSDTVIMPSGTPYSWIENQAWCYCRSATTWAQRPLDSYKCRATTAAFLWQLSTRWASARGSSRCAVWAMVDTQWSSGGATKTGKS